MVGALDALVPASLSVEDCADAEESALRAARKAVSEIFDFHGRTPGDGDLVGNRLSHGEPLEDATAFAVLHASSQGTARRGSEAFPCCVTASQGRMEPDPDLLAHVSDDSPQIGL